MKYKPRQFKGFFLVAYDENEMPVGIFEDKAELMKFFEVDSLAVMNSKLSRYFTGKHQHIQAGEKKYTLAKIKDRSRK